MPRYQFQEAEVGAPGAAGASAPSQRLKRWGALQGCPISSTNPTCYPETSRSALRGSVGAPDAAVASAPPPQRLKWWGALIIGLGSSLFLLLTGLFMLWLCWQRSSVRLANEEVRPLRTALLCLGLRQRASVKLMCTDAGTIAVRQQSPSHTCHSP